MQDHMQFCSSSNGDSWFLARDDAGNAFVLHRANAASGGAATQIRIANFLSGNPDAPEHRALLQLIGTLIVDKPAESIAAMAKPPSGEARIASVDENPPSLLAGSA